ncbi:MAG: type III polyketide synthase [Planctomycetaceae bacterium]|nr:type III polyketide synthase [Planctomycetaceae bacterium]
MSFEILGIGTANPAYLIEQSDAADIAKELCLDDDKQKRQMVALYRRSGVKSRHSVLLESPGPGTEDRQSFYYRINTSNDPGPDTVARMAQYESHAPQLVIQAARKALNQANVNPAEITHLVTVSCSGFVAPGFDIELMIELGLSSETARTHVGFMGCHGALNGLRVAKGFTDANPEACVLVCAVELCSLHHQYGWNPQQIVANSLFADGAAALVGRRRTEARSTETWSISANGSNLIPNSREMMSWRIGNNGFEMGLSPEVPGLIKDSLPAWIEQWLSRFQLQVDQIKSWIIHPGGPRILQATGEALNLPAEQVAPSQKVLEELGNMSSPTVLFIMERLQQAKAELPCVMLGFGPGLVVEAALIQ